MAQCRRHGHRPENPLLHYLTVGIGLGFKTRSDADFPPHDEPPTASKADLSGPQIGAEPDDEPVGQRSVPQSSTTSSGQATRRLHLDTPVLLNGAVEAPVSGKLEITGWALARAGVVTIEISLDGAVVMSADHGLCRRDVQSAFPDWHNALSSGFLASLPQRLLSRGAHQISVILRDAGGGSTSIDFGIVVEPSDESVSPWALRRQISAAERDLAYRLLALREWRPVFQVVMAVPSGSDLRAACKTIASLRAQVYGDWRLTLIEPPGIGDQISGHAQLFAAADSLGERCQRVAGFSPEAIPAGTAFLAMLRPGGELGCDAFLEMALASAEHNDADFFYSDERRLNPGSGEIEAFFKPQWSPDLLLSTNYVGQLWCARVGLVRKIVDPDEDLSALSDYELVLRLTEAASAIRHVPAVLCERDPAITESIACERDALDRALHRRGIAGSIQPGFVRGTYRVRRPLAEQGLVSIIIPTRAAQGMIRRCIESIRRQTSYRNIEIVCIENIPLGEAEWCDWLSGNADRVLSSPLTKCGFDQAGSSAITITGTAKPSSDATTRIIAAVCPV